MRSRRRTESLLHRQRNLESTFTTCTSTPGRAIPPSSFHRRHLGVSPYRRPRTGPKACVVIVVITRDRPDSLGVTLHSIANDVQGSALEEAIRIVVVDDSVSQLSRRVNRRAVAESSLSLIEYDDVDIQREFLTNVTRTLRDKSPGPAAFTRELWRRE